MRIAEETFGTISAYLQEMCEKTSEYANDGVWKTDISEHQDWLDAARDEERVVFARITADFANLDTSTTMIAQASTVCYDNFTDTDAVSRALSPDEATAFDQLRHAPNLPLADFSDFTAARAFQLVTKVEDNLAKAKGNFEQAFLLRLSLVGLRSEIEARAETPHEQ